MKLTHFNMKNTVMYRFAVSLELDAEIKIALIKERMKGKKIEQRDFLPQLLKKGLKK